MLVIYPADGADSFVDVAEADIIIGGFVPSEGKTAYLALLEADKEAYLRQAFVQISSCSGITLPDTSETALGTAQCYLVVYSQTVETVNIDVNERAITGERVDSLAVSYDSDKRVSSDTFPPMVYSLLRPFGCQNNSQGGMCSVRTIKG